MILIMNQIVLIIGLKIIIIWLIQIKLIILFSKTLILISIKNKLNFVIDNNLITYKTTFKYLDIIFDNNLSLKHHIGYLVNKLYKITSKIYFLKKTYKLNTKTLLNLYHSLFYPHINYCNTVWACNYKSNIKKIQTLQNLTIRTIFNYPFDKHINY